MKNYAKFVLSLLFVIALSIACSKSDKDKQNTQNQDQNTNKLKQVDTVHINKDQYRIAEQFTGSKSQIIDLIKGPANFVLTHQGTGHFKAILMYADGTGDDVLADVNGNYTGKKKVEVPETRAYILNVETTGTWSAYRE